MNKDPIKEASRILRNLKNESNLGLLLRALNARGETKGIFTAEVFEDARVISLKSKKLHRLESMFNVKISPLVLILPSENFREFSRRCFGESSGGGKFFHPNPVAPYPFNYIGINLAEARSIEKETRSIAWHEIRHALFEKYTEEKNISDNHSLSELFAYIHSVRAKFLTWQDVCETITKRFSVSRGSSTFDKLNIIIPLLSIVTLQKEEIDLKVLNSNSLDDLINELDKSVGRIGKKAKEYLFLLTSRVGFLPEEQVFKKLNDRGLIKFMDWAKKIFEELNSEGKEFNAQKLVTILNKKDYNKLTRALAGLECFYAEQGKIMLGVPSLNIKLASAVSKVDDKILSWWVEEIEKHAETPMGHSLNRLGAKHLISAKIDNKDSIVRHYEEKAQRSMY